MSKHENEIFREHQVENELQTAYDNIGLQVALIAQGIKKNPPVVATNEELDLEYQQTHSDCCDGIYDQDRQICLSCKEPANNQVGERK